MMILAVDTATASMSVALRDQGSLLGEITLQAGLTHSETLMPSIDSLFRQCSRRKTQLKAIGCASGPGSYTGIRIGVSTSLGIAYASQIPAFGFSTLEVMAIPHQHDSSNLICPVIDARNNRVFASAYYLGKQVISPDNYLISDFRLLIDQAAQAYHISQALILGSGRLGFFHEGLADGCRIMVLPDYDAVPRGSVIASMTEQAYLKRADMSPAESWQELKPYYISLTQAERNRLKQPEKT